MMGVFGTCYNRLSDFFFAPQSTAVLGLYRLIFGSFFFFYILIFAPWYFEYSTVEGFMGIDGVSTLQHWGKPGFFDMWPGLYHYVSEDQVPLGVILVLLTIATVAFTFGFWTNIASVAMYFLWGWILDKNGLTHQGEAGLMRFALLYHIFLPLGARYSLREYLWRNRAFFPGHLVWVFFGAVSLLVSIILAHWVGWLSFWLFLGSVISFSYFLFRSVVFGPPRVKLEYNPFVLRLFQINVLVVYLWSLPYKLVDDFCWVNGTALFWTVIGSRWGLSPWGAWMATAFDGYLVIFMTYWAIFCEGFFAFFVWFRRTRLVACLLLFQLHLGIALSIPAVMGFNLAGLLNIFIFLRLEDYRFLARVVASVADSAKRLVCSLFSSLLSYFRSEPSLSESGPLFFVEGQGSVKTEEFKSEDGLSENGSLAKFGVCLGEASQAGFVSRSGLSGLKWVLGGFILFWVLRGRRSK